MFASLSDGTVVTFKDYVSHKADKLMFEAMTAVESSPLRSEDEKAKERTLAYLRAIEQALPLVIQSIVKGDNSIPCNQGWLDELPREDYGKLQESAMSLYSATQKAKEEGKKISG